MKLLLDENIAPRVGELLRERGIDARHVSEYDLLGQPDDMILAVAVQEERILVTADTDFGALLALTGASRPSVLLLRGPSHRADARAAQIVLALQAAAQALSLGSLVVIADGTHLRIRALPITSPER